MSVHPDGGHESGSGLPIFEVVDGVHQIGDQIVLQGNVLYPDVMTIDEVKEAMARAHGGDKDSYAIGIDEVRKSKFGKFTLGFRKWNSSWDPKGNPNDN